jgi:hypothetical protein
MKYDYRIAILIKLKTDLSIPSKAFLDLFYLLDYIFESDFWD